MTLDFVEHSKDGTLKLVFKQGHHCVLIPQKDAKVTLCISSQVGCVMDCKFCYTSKMGFMKNLSSNEILEQYEESLKELKEINSKYKITAIVFMGMGEPLANVKEVLESCEKLNTEFNFSYKKITISTSGLIIPLQKLVKENHKFHLALSLHSPFQEIRNKLMPRASHFEISDLVKICNEYSSKRKDKMMIEYIMIDGLTDRDEDLKELLLLGFVSMTNINLIPLNGEMELNGKVYGPSSLKRCEKFKEELVKAGYKSFIRYNRGEDIKAACGMLSSKV